MLAVAIVRVTVAILLGIHGFSRALKGDVHGFGDFLASQHLPLGHAVAWGITAFEMAGSICLLTNRLVRIAALGHMVILLSGIAMVHAKNGWFVVGGGFNGAEYSVLLVACLAAVFVANTPRLARSHPRSP